MPIEVEALAPEEATEATEVVTEPTLSHTPPPEEAAPRELVQRPTAKARGRPRGSKNRPKAQAEEEEETPEELVVVKRKPKKVVYISESEEEAPPSPGTQRKNEWAAYRQKQVNAHQARSAHYTKALDKMLAF